MGFFDTYQPTEKDRWQMKQREERDRRARRDADAREAQRIRQQMMRDEIRAEQDRQKVVDSIRAQADREAAAQEKAILTQPFIRPVGGTDGVKGGILVWHFRCEPPNGILLKQQRPGSGFILRLPRGGGVRGEDTVLSIVDRARPEWIDAHPAWVQSCTEAIKDMKSRYLQLFRTLRDDKAMGLAFHAAGVTMDRQTEETVTGAYGTYTCKVTERSIPALTEVVISPSGLELVYAARLGDSAKNWNARIDPLRNAFRGLGVDASNLSITDDAAGNIKLSFNDAPSAFPAAVCVEPPTTVATSNADAIRRYEGAAWTLGVDSRGKCIKFPVEEFPHVLVVGGTGAGKSVWARSIIEMFRTGYRDPDTGRDTAGGFTCYVSSGKVTDFVTLSKLPGVAMVAGDAAQTAVMVRTVKEEAVRRYDEAAAAKLRGETRAFDYPPIVLFLDEWGATWLALSSMYKSTGDFESDIDWILRVGREARVHVVLLSQTIRKTGAGAVPGSWQANLGLTISLGKPEAETYNNPAVFPGGSRERAELVGNRIAGKKGRGMAVLEGNVIEFQSYYVWSPGTTSLDPEADKKVRPPTPEVRELWESWEPISASVPWLAPRLGLRVDSPEWAGTPGEKNDLKDVLATPVVALTDRSGAVRAGMGKYDPWSPEWVGKHTSSGVRRSALSFDDEPEPAPAPEPATEPEPDDLLEALAEAQRRGLIPMPEPAPSPTAPTPTRAPVQPPTLPDDD